MRQQIDPSETLASKWDIEGKAGQDIEGGLLARDPRWAAWKVLPTGIVAAGIFFFLFHARDLSPPPIIDLALFAGIILFAGLLEISLPQGGFIASSAAPVVAAIILFPMSEAVWMIALGLSLVILRKNRPMVPPAQGIVVAAFAAFVFGLLGGRPGEHIDLIRDFMPLLGLALAYFILDVSLDRLLLSARKRTAFKAAWIGAFKFLSPVYLALLTTGILMALLHQKLSYWGVILLILALLVTRHSFNLYTNIKRAYRDTIGALSKVIDLQGERALGHSQEVADYAVDLARELGFSSDQLEILNYAALLKDLGKVAEEEDESGLANNHAQVGAEMVKKVESLKDTAGIIGHHHTPYMEWPRGVDKRILKAAGIVHVVGAYQFLVRIQARSAAQAYAEIRRGQGTLYEPATVRAFRIVLVRRGLIGPSEPVSADLGRIPPEHSGHAASL